MHVHASDKQLTEGGSAKFFVKENGDTVLQNRGRLNDREILKIESFIKKNYREMFLKWSAYSENGSIAWITPKDLSNFHGRFCFRQEHLLDMLLLQKIQYVPIKGLKVLFQIRIPVSISEQRKIAEILGSLDNKIEENERINNNL